MAPAEASDDLVRGFRVGKTEIALHVADILTEERIEHCRLKLNPSFGPSSLVDGSIERCLDKGILARGRAASNCVVDRLQQTDRQQERGFSLALKA
jgi:hypothetical protein